MKKQMTRNYYLKNKSRNHHFTAVRSHSLREEHRLFSGAASFDILAKIFEIQIPKDNSLKTRLRLIQFTQVRFFSSRERHICDYWLLIHSAWTT